MGKIKIAIKAPGTPLEVTEIEGIYRTDVKQCYADSNDTYLQYVRIDTEKDRVLCFACDECGKLKGLAHNFFLITQSGNHRFCESITGTVVFLVYRWEDPFEQEIYDFELESLTDEDIAKIEYIISEECQKKSKHMAQIDPYVHKTPTVIFEPIKDINSYLFPAPTSCCMIPSILIPMYLFLGLPGNRHITFYTEPAAENEYESGVISGSSDSTLLVYCKAKTIAHSYTQEIVVNKNSTSETYLNSLIESYMKILYEWGLPGMLYVSHNTKQELDANFC